LLHKKVKEKTGGRNEKRLPPSELTARKSTTEIPFPPKNVVKKELGGSSYPCQIRKKIDITNPANRKKGKGRKAGKDVLSGL